MFFPSQSRGFLSIQIPLNAVFRTTGTSPRLLPFHLILWWACDLCFLLLPQTLFSSAPLLVGTPTPSPLSVGTLQIFTLSPPPFIFIVSILTNHPLQQFLLLTTFFPPFVNFCLWHTFFGVTLLFQPLFRWDFFYLSQGCSFLPFLFVQNCTVLLVLQPYCYLWFLILPLPFHLHIY